MLARTLTAAAGTAVAFGVIGAPAALADTTVSVPVQADHAVDVHHVAHVHDVHVDHLLNTVLADVL